MTSYYACSKLIRCPLQSGDGDAEIKFEDPSRPNSKSEELNIDEISSLSLLLSSHDSAVQEQYQKLRPRTKCKINRSLLDLPGEVRNIIYHYALSFDLPFAVKIQFGGPRETALLRVNKQVHHEATSIFYFENTFRFPQSLFVGPTQILKQLQGLYHLPATKLQTMRKLELDIPVRNPNCSVLSFHLKLVEL